MKKALFILTLIIVGGLTFSCSTDEYDVTQEKGARKTFDSTEEMMRPTTPADSTSLPTNTPNMNTEPIGTNLDDGNDNGGGTLNPPKR
ncbi:hypothetical protein [Flavobacterium cerinum]|uniref:Cytochrome C551 n=1 Tax=Flavobacterium cerinum TaxID=2502784 RepID=A0ABY5IWT1_9FLAO|nr:hypothetical protein [Flavobacterium cerinum]UUC45962.1 hypothetical protein NOX80_01865 [Flavobacterium cerinum]